MRSHRLRSRTAHSALRPRSGVSIGDIAIRIAAPGARTRVDARGAARECVHRRAGDAGPGHRACGRRHLDRSRAASGPPAPTGAPVPDRARWTRRRSATTAPPPRSPSPTPPRSTPSTFDAAAPAYSFTVQNGATFTITNQTSNSSSLLPAFSVSTGATLALGNGAFVEIGVACRWRQRRRRPVRSLHHPVIAGSTSTTFSGVISRARARSKSTAAQC